MLYVGIFILVFTILALIRGESSVFRVLNNSLQVVAVVYIIGLIVQYFSN